MRKGLVSAIVPNYNYAHFLRETIDSILGQTYPDIEIIVVDDGSKDNSREVLDSYGDRVRAIYQKNAGVSAARNNGVRASTGEYLAFLDADDTWLPTKIEKQVARFAADPTLGLVHVGVTEVDADGSVRLERLEGVEGDVSGDLLMLKRAGVLGGGSGIMVPREIFDEVEGFDERMSTSADWDLFYQIAGRYPVGFVPELLIKYRVHNSNMHANVAAMERDMNLAFERAFDGTIGRNEAIKGRAYAVLNRTLAASYFKAGQYGPAVRTAVKSLASDPKVILLPGGLDR